MVTSGEKEGERGKIGLGTKSYKLLRYKISYKEIRTTV